MIPAPLARHIAFLVRPGASLHPARARQCAVWGLPPGLAEKLAQSPALSHFLIRHFKLLPAPVLDLAPLPSRCLLLDGAVLESGCLRLGLARRRDFLTRLISGAVRRKLAARMGEENLAFARRLPPGLAPAPALFPLQYRFALAHGRDLLLAALGGLPPPHRRRFWLKLPPGLPRHATPPPPPPGLLERIFAEPLHAAGL